MVLDQGVLDAVRSLQKDEYTFDQQFEIFERVVRYNEADIQLVARCKRYLALADDMTLQEVAGLLEVDKEHLPDVRVAVQKYISEHIITPRLAPIHEMAVGMSISPFQDTVSFAHVQAMHPAEFSRKLQGTISKEDIIGRLQFSSSEPPMVQNRVQNLLVDWIQKADQEKLQLFLFALSGSSAIGEAVKITIAKGASICFRTCAFRLDLDYENILSESDLTERLDVVLQIIKADPRFDFC